MGTEKKTKCAWETDTVNGGQLDKRFDDFLYHHLLFLNL